jgi:hypothetical protein
MCYCAIDMAQAWHREREQLGLAQGTDARRWRATEYRLDDPENPSVIEAAPDARWERVNPFDSYKPTTTAREVEAGPHLTFMNLKEIQSEKRHLFDKSRILFANEFGLLGFFEEDYLARPLLPPVAPIWVAPEGVIDAQGRLRQVDPATEGRDLLFDLLIEAGYFFPQASKDEWQVEDLAMPSELKFIRTERLVHYLWRSFEEPSVLVPWREIQAEFGAILVLDEASVRDETSLPSSAWSVLCTREPLRRWSQSLLSFPGTDTHVEWLGLEHGVFNNYLRTISPYASVGEDGNLKRGWRCRSLLQAMYLMFYLDQTGDSSIRKCQSRGCPNYFRVGSQSKSKYCSQRCANRASTRIRRGQVP